MWEFTDHEMYNLLHILCMEDIDPMSTILLETLLIVADNTRHCFMTHVTWNVSNGLEEGCSESNVPILDFKLSLIFLLSKYLFLNHENYTL